MNVVRYEQLDLYRISFQMVAISKLVKKRIIFIQVAFYVKLKFSMLPLLTHNIVRFVVFQRNFFSGIHRER